MFQVGNYRVEFEYDSVPEQPWCAMKTTSCWIVHVDGNNESDVAYGTSYCSVKDQFNKNTGRKIALSRALKHLTDDKEYRKKFWDAYFATRHGKY